MTFTNPTGSLTALLRRSVLTAAALLLTACVSAPPSTDQKTVRSIPPQNHEKAIASYFDVTVRGVDPNRELTYGTPQRGACAMGAAAGGYVGWVVPVEYKTRSKDNGTVIITRYFFWFADETIRGVTRRMEVCP